MKKMLAKRVLAGTLCGTMLATSLAGCGGSASSATVASSESASSAATEATTDIDISKHVDLTMYLIGDPTEDFDMMWEEANKWFNENLNCTVNVEWLSWSEHRQKYSLLFSGNEDFDLIFTGINWAHYEEIAPLGGFYPLTEDFVATYGPRLLENVPENGWEQAMYGGIPYMVPQNFMEIKKDCVAIRGDLMEEYGFDSIDSLQDLYDFYLACGEHGMHASQVSYFDQWYLSKGWNYVNGSPDSYLFYYDAYNPDDKNLYYILDDEDFVSFCKDIKTLADAGAWTADSLSSTAERQEGLLNGTNAAMNWNRGSCVLYANQANEAHPDWNVQLVDPTPDVKAGVTVATNSGMAINAASDNPERAMMVIEALYCDEYLQQLTRLGIEGVHWEAVGDDQYTLLKTTLGVDSYCDWGWRNDNIMRTEYVPEEKQTSAYKSGMTLYNKWKENLREDHVYDGFTFDTTNVATQCAAVDTVFSTYFQPMVFYGQVSDVDSYMAEFKQALEDAGIRDIQAEIQRQMDEFVASK